MNRLKPFSYFEPTKLAEAIEIGAGKGGECCFLAGGTDLVVRMKRGEIMPSSLVNLKRIEGLNRIAAVSGEGTRIGALTSISAIERSRVIEMGHPVLSQAAGSIGAPSIRNLGTIGGNIGRGSPASDMAPALMVTGTRVKTQGPAGEKEQDLDEIFSGPGVTNLAPGEIITSFFVPNMAPSSAAVYLRLGRREGMDCALVGVAALIELSEIDNQITDVRIALASVGPTPLRARTAEKVLLNFLPTPERIEEAARAAAEDAHPISDLRASRFYRQEILRVFTSRALSKALHQIKGGEST